MKIQSAVLIALAMTLTVTTAQNGFRQCPQNGHYYKAVHVPEGISWSSAKAAAEKAGGYLATITSQEENKFLFRLVDREELWVSNTPYDNFGPWIGGYQEKGAREPAGGWRWVTGEEFFFVDWAPMEPTGRWKGKNENRLQLYCKNNRMRKPRWNDSWDTPDGPAPRSYIIEKGAVETEARDAVVTEPIDEFHDFHGVNGKTCRGRIVAYSPATDRVTIAKTNKRTHKVGLSNFSEADQIYVHDWHLVKEFCTEANLHITTKKKKMGDDREIEFHDNEGRLRSRQRMEEIGYVVSLENRSGTNLSGVLVEYCIYYQQERPNQMGKMLNKGVKCGSMEIGTLAVKTKVQVKTQTVTISKRELEAGFNDDRVFEGKVLGIWARVYLPLANGNKAMRECSMPNDLMKVQKWATSDVDADIEYR